MEKIKYKHIGKILQQIYDSEIHLRIGWMWDGGVDFLEGTKTMSVWEGLEDCIMRGTGEVDMRKAMEKIVKHLIAVYPKSEFAKWFIKEFHNETKHQNNTPNRIMEEKLEEILALVNEQAEDEGLWFRAVTAPEAYLQQELRKLHMLIESNLTLNK